MCPVGAVNTITGAALVDKVQTVSQNQINAEHRHIENQAAREQVRQRTTVDQTTEDEKVRMRQKGEERRRKKQQPENENEATAPAVEEEQAIEEAPAIKRINVTV